MRFAETAGGFDKAGSGSGGVFLLRRVETCWRGKDALFFNT